MEEDSLKYVSNPLNAFLIIKRLSVDVSEAISGLKKIQENFESNCEAFRLTEEDYDGAGDGLTRLQMFYGLETKELASGVIQGQQFRELSVDDLFSIGMLHLKNERHELSLSYFESALDKNNQTLEMADMVILETIHDVHASSGNTEGVVKTIERMIKILPDSDDRRDELQYDHDVASGKMTKELLKKYQKLVDTCTGKLHKTPRELSRLRCRFVSKSAFSQLTPFKVEEMSLDPYMAVYHDIISDSEIEVFKDSCKPVLQRASVLSFNQTRAISKVRTSKNCPQLDSDHEVFARVTQRVEDMTGLHKESAESFQTQNYGIGGHYDRESCFCFMKNCKT